MNHSLLFGAAMIAFRRLVFDVPGGRGEFRCRPKSWDPSGPACRRLRWVTQPFPSESTVTSCGSALRFGSSYSTAMYLVASPLTKVRGKRLLGSGFGLAAARSAAREIRRHIIQQNFRFLIGQVFGKR